MHEALTDIQKRLENVVESLRSNLPDDQSFGIAHANWSFPGLSKGELVEEVQAIIDYIGDHGPDDLGDAEPRITDYARRLDYLSTETVPNIWGNAGQAVPAFQLTIDGLRKVLSSVLNKDHRAEAVKQLRKLKRQLRGMEAQINGLEPRTASLVEMVERIEQAYHAADKLPTDLESLAEARDKIGHLVRDATRDQSRVLDIQKSADKLDKKLKESSEQAKAVLDRCETAYSAATSVGLAAAFSERSNALSTSMWFWIGGLVVALAIGSFFGSNQVHTFVMILDVSDPSASMIALNVVLSLLSVGAPVWFAWLATKQIGQRFRLAEDYAFKASISRAYEGFRRETARFGKDMEAKLLISALTRLDELPLRLVEAKSHGSPWHELASSEIIGKAMKEVPGFAGQVRDLARKGIDTVIASKGKQKPAPPATRGADE